MSGERRANLEKKSEGPGLQSSLNSCLIHFRHILLIMHCVPTVYYKASLSGPCQKALDPQHYFLENILKTINVPSVRDIGDRDRQTKLIFALHNFVAFVRLSL